MRELANDSAIFLEFANLHYVKSLGECLSFNLGIGKRTVNYWSLRQCGAQVVFHLTSARRRLKLY
jgi:hypothetical protein